ncbi:4-coumarate--CoA ligase-like 7 [Mycena kentingensis (nom. inval.)]|nr:4-coumarate--CoA ligase-like 7 [Mycena kentingensis (nom. inval.)]
MSPRIYSSPYPARPIPRTSTFTFLLSASSRDSERDGHSKSEAYIGNFPATRTAFVDAQTGTSITRGQLRAMALAFGYGLQARFSPVGARRGDTVLVFSPNSLAWPVVLFGCVAAGLKVTTANSAYTSRELAHQYVDSGARIVIAADEGVDIVRGMFAKLGIAREDGDARVVVTCRGDLRWAGGPGTPLHPLATGLLRMEDLLSLGALEEEERFDGDLSDETAYLCYSSGTTGKPKGVETTHYNAISLLTIVRTTFVPVQPTDVMIAILPFYHVYALMQVLQLPLIDGLPVVIQSRFEPTEYCANIARYGVSISLIVPPVLVVLARHAAAEEYDLSSLRYLCSGAAPLGKDLVQQVKARLSKRRKAGTVEVVVTQGY